MQFSIRSLLLVTAILMGFIAILVQLPYSFVLLVAFPATFASLTILPYVTIKFFLLLTDPSDRTLHSPEMQRTVQVLLICLFTAAPAISLLIIFVIGP